MPIPVGTPPIKWWDYLQKDLPSCPYNPLDDAKSTTDVRKTHPPSRASLAACSGKTILVSTSGIINRFLARDIHALFDGLEGDCQLIIPEEDYIQPLLNEQGVAEVFFMNVLVPVKDALQTLLKPLLERKDMAEPRYFFNIRQQQYSPTKDSTRSDHFLVFEHRDGIDPEDKVTAPNKRVIWQSPKEFANMLQARVAWEVSNPNATAADRKKAPPYPRLVLGVIEEKKPDVVQESEFSHDYANQNSQGAKNVNAFLPQLKKYSIDAQCRLVILTDYLTTLLLDVQKAGARWDPIEETIKPIPGEVARVAVCRLDQKPRYALFSIAVRRLIDAASVKMTRGRPT